MGKMVDVGRVEVRGWMGIVIHEVGYVSSSLSGLASKLKETPRGDKS